MKVTKWQAREISKDVKAMPFNQFLDKYFKIEDSNKWSIDWYSRWLNWLEEYVFPAYDPSRRAEFVANFGLVDESKFDFVKMAALHSELQELRLFPEDIERFLGFMAGTGFFKGITLTEWLDSINWSRKYAVPEGGINKTPLELIRLRNGDNFLRANLTLIDWWRR